MSPHAPPMCRTMTTLTPHITRYIAGRSARGELAPTTVPGIRHWLGHFSANFGRRPLDQFTRRAIDRWMATIGSFAPGSRRNALSAVRGFCRWMHAEGLIGSDPTIGVPPIRQPRSVPRAMPAGDVGRLIAHAPDARARAIIWLMVGCGLRCIEVARLTVDDYDDRARTIRVVGKGGHERELPVPAEVRQALDGYLAEVGSVSGPLIRSERGRGHGLAPGTISLYMARWMTAAEVKHGRRDGRSAHALRHTCASDVLDGGASLPVVQEMLGHRQLATTSVYLRRASIGQMRSAMEGRTYATRGGEDDYDTRYARPTWLEQRRVA